jgi:hypothetical protein
MNTVEDEKTNDGIDLVETQDTPFMGVRKSEKVT